MLNDEDEPPARPRVQAPKLETMGLAELDAYIGELRDEIRRAEAEIARKRGHRTDADRLFKWS